MRAYSTLLLLCGPARFAAAAVATFSDQDIDSILLPRAVGADCKLPSPAGGGAGLSEGFGASRACAPSRGVLSALMFFVDFPDQTASGTGNDSLQSLKEFFAPSIEWYHTSSYGRLNLSITADTSKFYRVTSQATSYGFERSLDGNMHVKYIRDSVDAFLSGGGKIPSAYDVVYIVPTRNARAITFSPTSPVRVQSRSGVEVSKFGAVTVGMDAYRGWQYKVINHETGHSMCLPDLYPEGRAVGEYVGGWDIMGYILGTGPDFFAWHKWKLGWLDDTQINCLTGAGSTTHTIYPLEVKSTPTGAAADTKAVVFRRNNTAALVAEVRAKLGVDTSTCATGVLLYTVSTAGRYGSGPIRVVDSKPRSGGCGREELSDGTLNMQGIKTLAVPGWGINVTVVEQTGDVYTIKVDIS